MQRPFPAYEGDEPYVFVCYSHADRELVYPEIRRLHELGLNLWYDDGIAPGSEWSETLASSIRGCATFLYFVTPRSVLSEHCRREVNFALEQSCALVAVHLEPTTLPDGLKLSLSNRQAVLRYEHSTPNYEARLSRALQSNGEAPAAGGAIRLGEWTLDLGTERLTRPGEEQPLDPKELSVLLHLIDRAPEVVTTEGLLSRTWPEVVVGDNALQQVITRLRRALGDDARHPRYIETLPKRGYRLCIPVSNAPPAPHQAASAGTARLQRYWKPGALALLTLLLAGIALAVWNSATSPTGGHPQRLRIAVEPFDHPAGNERLASYSRLLRNELTAHLARLGQPRTDVTERAADADFLVRSSISEVSDRVRLSTEVIDTATGTAMWNKPLDLPRQPTSELIATRPEHLATLIFQVASYSRSAARLTPSTEAARAWLAGMIEQGEMWQGLGGDWSVALTHFRRASEIDPQFVLAPMSLANLYLNRMGRKLQYRDAIGPIHEHTRRVLELEPDWTWHLGWVNTHDLDYTAAAANYEHARRAGHPATYMEFNTGLLLQIQGRLEDAIVHFNTTLELGALENQAMTHVFIAGAYLAGGRYKSAARAADTAVIETAGTGTYAHLHALEIQGYARYHSGDAAGARDTRRRMEEAYGADHPEALAGLAALLGETAVARRALSDGEARWVAGEGLFPSRYFLGYYYLGELDQAFVWLRRAIEDREVGMLPYLRRSPILDPIRNDPRFIDVLERLAEVEAIRTPIASVAYTPEIDLPRASAE